MDVSPISMLKLPSCFKLNYVFFLFLLSHTILKYVRQWLNDLVSTDVFSSKGHILVSFYS